MNIETKWMDKMYEKGSPNNVGNTEANEWKDKIDNQKIREDYEKK